MMTEYNYKALINRQVWVRSFHGNSFNAPTAPPPGWVMPYQRLLNLGVQGVQSIRLDFSLFICWRRMNFSAGYWPEVSLYIRRICLPRLYAACGADRVPDLSRYLGDHLCAATNPTCQGGRLSHPITNPGIPRVDAHLSCMSSAECFHSQQIGSNERGEGALP